MIRKAAIEDLPRLHGLANEFYSASSILGRLPFEMHRFVKAWTNFLESEIGVIFLAVSIHAPERDNNTDRLASRDEVTGMIGGIQYPDLYSGVLIATEFFWFVSEANRGTGIRLYKAFEGWAKEQGCEQIRMIHLNDSMPEKLAKFYLRLGYEQSETHYLKEL